jgi:hypothetical protein
MITINTLTFIAGDPRIGEYMRQGATMYRARYEPDKVYIVPMGANHSKVWDALTVEKARK